MANKFLVLLRRCKNNVVYHKIQCRSISFQCFSPDQGFYCQSPYERFPVSNLLIHEYVWKDVKQWSDKDAIVCGATGRKFTYSQLQDASAALAIRLKTKYNLKTGETVAICLPNIPEFPIALLGSIQAGLTVTTINPKYTTDEILHQITSSNVKLIFGLAHQYQHFTDVEQRLKRSLYIVSVKMFKSQSIYEKSADFNDLISCDGLDFTQVDNNGKGKKQNSKDVCILPYSSGTTGLPKGVMLTHENLTSNCELLNANLPKEQLIIPTTSAYQDILPCILPFFHMYGMMVTLLSKLSLGCKLITLSEFQLDDLLKCIQDHRATFVHLVPHIMIFWTQYSIAKSKHIQSIRTIMSAAASLGALDYDRFRERYPKIELLQGYGLTESGGLLTVTPKYCTNYASIGFPTSNVEAKIVKLDDSQTVGLDADETGELLVRGPVIMKGYLNNESSTNEMILKDGWLRTGDLAFYDNDGHFYIKGRLKELIKVKGFQVAPAELEEILRDHPKVLDAVVIGVPHPIDGEVPRAFVVKVQNVNVTKKELKDYVAKKVTSYKHLNGGIEFVDFIPKTESGKPLRRKFKLD